MELKKEFFERHETLGTDVEVFIKETNNKTKKSKIIGSEKILPEKKINIGAFSGFLDKDGIQAEIQTTPSSCRQIFYGNLKRCFTDTTSILNKASNEHKTYSICFKTNNKITKKEFYSLSDECKAFGCSPSYNVYEDNYVNRPITVNPQEYRGRSAGGHLHFSISDETVKKNINSIGRIVKLMDYLLGNASVLFDTDKKNVERRKNYGRAGEFRIPKYGIEYRVLGNFWLRGEPIASLFTRLGRICISLEAFNENDIIKNIFDSVPEEDIIKAINKNNYSLALKNFKKLAKTLSKIYKKSADMKIFSFDEIFGKNGEYILKFLELGGTDAFFPKDDEKIIEQLINQGTSRMGWESFINSIKDKEVKK